MLHASGFRAGFTGLAALGLSAGGASALTIDVQHVGGYFSGNATAAAALAAAAADVSALITTSLAPTQSHFEAIVGSTTGTIDATYNYPGGSTGTVLSQDQYILRAGGQSLGGDTAGVGSPSGFGYSAGVGGFPSEFQSAMTAVATSATTNLLRGDGPTIGSLGGALDSPYDSVTFSVSYGAGMGTINFDSDGSTDWHYDHTTPVASGKIDFYSVALHEILHALGIGSALSWDSLVSGNDWTGSNVIALLGSGADVLEGDANHIVDGLMSTVINGGAAQEAAMDPSILAGTRKYLTTLDAAFLQDIGWTVAVPEPATLALFGLAAALLVRRR